MTTGRRLITRWRCAWRPANRTSRAASSCSAPTSTNTTSTPISVRMCGVPILPWDNDVMIRLSFETVGSDTTPPRRCAAVLDSQAFFGSPCVSTNFPSCTGMRSPG